MRELHYQTGDHFGGAAQTVYDYFLQTVTAEKFLKVYDEPLTLEGVCFDRQGDLYFTSTMGNSIFRYDMKNKQLTTVFYKKNVRPAAVKFHRDGRLFAACLTNEAIGGVIAMGPDGSKPEYIVKGYSIDDMVFDAEGGFYFTDFTGDIRNPCGGVYYVSPDFQKVTLFCGNLCQPNGIALSRDGTILWVTETQAGRLHRFNLKTGRANVVYYFSGMVGPDSCEIDADDNLYVAMPEQGCVLIFNYFGALIGRVVMPGYKEGHHLFVTHPMVRPGCKELYMTCKDTAKNSEGSWLFHSASFAEGNPDAYQFR